MTVPPAALRTTRPEFSLRSISSPAVHKLQTSEEGEFDAASYGPLLNFSKKWRSRYNWLRARFYFGLGSFYLADNPLYISVFWKLHKLKAFHSHFGVTFGDENTIASIAVDHEVRLPIGRVVFYSQLDSGNYTYKWHGIPGRRRDPFYGLRLSIREWKSSVRVGGRYHFGSAMLSFESGYSVRHTSHLEFRGGSNYFPEEFHSKNNFWTSVSLGFKF